MACIAATMGMSALLSACAGGRSATPTQPPYGYAVSFLARFQGVISARMPVYLPSAFPPPPRGYVYVPNVQSMTNGYEIQVFTEPYPARFGDGTTGALAALLRAGPAAAIVGAVAAMAEFTGTGTSVSLTGARAVRVYNDQGVRWTAGAWTYAIVANPASLGGPVLTRRVGNLTAGGNPVGPGTSGWVVDNLTQGSGRTYVAWVDAPWGYSIEGVSVPAIEIARSWVRVR